MNERGFMTVSVLILLPLVLIALSVIAASYFVFMTDGRARHSCRVELLESQAAIAKDLEALLALNPEAQSLRRQRKVAEELATKAPSPATSAALALVVAEQMAFRLKQQSLLMRGRSHSRLDPHRALAKVQAVVVKDRHSESRESLNFNGSIRAAAFDVIATPLGSLTPDYQPAPGFEERQTMQVKWSFPVAPLIPAWMLAFLPGEKLQLKGECTGTLQRKGRKWEPKLKKAKR